ncbi:potassium voltage-gated channel subfamily KQT member 1-like isoform X3 [Athalia rosae]|uniref:potassium voltage-gated channel subfamily KQT member 1-like isoform X3 n=1 Tax=Athalia rosae TaxID=37344 RepID=UPI002033FA62|nr:potassium voltage-gated channel subfamily KQT member 1-like isoform X3 [Athalia rosae]
MTSETSSTADSPALLHRPLLTSSTRTRSGNLRQTSESCTPTSTLAQSPPNSVPGVRFHALEMDHKAPRSGAGGRLAAPRMSLLGRPVSYRVARRDGRYRRLQGRIYNFLERPRGALDISYHMVVICMVFTCFVLSVFSTIEEYEKEAGILLFYMEMVVVVWFTLEFCLRLWSSGCCSRYQAAIGRLKFLRRPFCIIDVVTIVSSIVVLGVGSSGQVFAASALRGLRFFQILRMVRMDRRGGTWKLLGSVVYAHRQELITTLYIGFLGLIFASFLVYLAEKEDEHFNNFAKALWWGVVTLCTVGYGDAVPKTWQGKVIASFCALLGISFFALPAGILGSGFALKVQQQQRQKHMIRRRQPAANLIQALWRCYAADEHSMSVATWKIHQIPLPSPPSRVSSSFKHNASFVSRLPTIRRHKSTSLHSPSLHKPGHQSHRGNATRSFADMNASAENLGGVSTNGGRQLNASHSEDSVTETALSKKNSDANVRLGRSSSTVDLRALGLDGLVGRLGETSTLPLALAGLMPHVTRVVPVLPFSPTISPNSEKYEDEEPRCIQLTNQHKGAIRAIRKIKYFVARKQFREALKPYDVKDVIEQYSSGHADLLNRVKNLQFRLDQILGKQGSKAKDVYASKISLASRVVNVERQVDEIEVKLDHLIELYMEDRKRLLALPLPASEAIPVQTGGGGGPGGGTGTGGVVSQILKPILIDKQLSEPSSPTSKTFSEKPRPRQIHRGHSDLSSRVQKKRVTLSSIPSHLSHPIEAASVIALGSAETSSVTSRSDEVVIVVPSPQETAIELESRSLRVYEAVPSPKESTRVRMRVSLKSSASSQVFVWKFELEKNNCRFIKIYPEFHVDWFLVWIDLRSCVTLTDCERFYSQLMIL